MMRLMERYHQSRLSSAYITIIFPPYGTYISYFGAWFPIAARVGCPTLDSHVHVIDKAYAYPEIVTASRDSFDPLWRHVSTTTTTPVNK